MGPRDGPLAILVHGAVVNRATMAPLARALPPFTRVWVPDLPGHGSRRAERFTLEAALAGLEQLVADAGPVPIVVAGDSLGGYLALLLGARCGGQLAGIVAGGSTFPMRGLAAGAAGLTDLPVSALAAIVGGRRVEAALLHAFVALGGDPETSAQTAAGGLRLAARRESLNALRSVDLAATVRAVPCPVTFVNGALDIPIAWLTGWYARLARTGRAVIVRGSAHGVMTLQPNAVAREIAALFER